MFFSLTKTIYTVGKHNGGTLNCYKQLNHSSSVKVSTMLWVATYSHNDPPWQQQIDILIQTPLWGMPAWLLCIHGFAPLYFCHPIRAGLLKQLRGKRSLGNRCKSNGSPSTNCSKYCATWMLSRWIVEDGVVSSDDGQTTEFTCNKCWTQTMSPRRHCRSRIYYIGMSS